MLIRAKLLHKATVTHLIRGLNSWKAHCWIHFAFKHGHAVQRLKDTVLGNIVYIHAQIKEALDNDTQPPWNQLSAICYKIELIVPFLVNWCSTGKQ